MIVKQILLVSTMRTVWKTVWRIGCIQGQPLYEGVEWKVLYKSPFLFYCCWSFNNFFFIIIIIIRATFLQLITSIMVTWSLQLAIQWLSIFWTNCTVLWHTFVLIWKIIGNGLNLFSQIVTQIYKKNFSCIRWFKAIETMAKLFTTTWTRNGRCLPL